MATDSIDVIEIFCSYSHKDEQLKKELEAHLSGMKRQGLITLWSDRQIDPGTGWKDAIDTHLESAEVILLLISADFIASDYCYEKEMMRALQRHKKGEARTIPIILREVDWKEMPFSSLQALPKDGKPISSWRDRDKAFVDVARGIRNVVEQLRREHIKQPTTDAVHWTLSLQGTIDEINRPQVETILSTLRGYVGNSQLQLQRIETGSVNCVFMSSRKVLRVIQSNMHSGELTQVAELKIIGIQETTTEETVETPRQSPIQSLFHRFQKMKNVMLLFLAANQIIRSKETWVVADDAPPQLLRDPSAIAQLGGAGKLIVQEGHVAITERSGRIARVVGAGTYQLEQYERPTMTVYLPLRTERVVISDILTRDSQMIQSLDLHVFHRVDKGNQSATSGLYQYDPQLILEKIWSPKGSDWRDVIKSISASKARDIIAHHDLEELVAISPISRRTLVNEFTEQINQMTRVLLGVEVVATNLGTITISDEAKKALEETFLMELESRTHALQSDVERQARIILDEVLPEYSSELGEEKDQFNREDDLVQAFGVSEKVRRFLLALAQLPIDEGRKVELITEIFQGEQSRELMQIYTNIRRSP